MFITNFCDDCNDICEIYRNKAAHSDIISHDKAADCGAHLIKVKKMIREFVEKIDFEKAKEYTEC